MVDDIVGERIASDGQPLAASTHMPPAFLDRTNWIWWNGEIFNPFLVAQLVGVLRAGYFQRAAVDEFGFVPGAAKRTGYQ